MNINYGNAVGVAIFWTSSPEPFSRVIKRVTGGEYSHMGIIFRFDSGREIYFESLFSAGVTGPSDVDKLKEWVRANAERRVLIEQLSWLTPEQCQHIYRLAYAQSGKAGYGKVQVISHWWMERVGKRYGFRMRNTPDRQTCSEFVTRVLLRYVSLLDKVRDHADSVTPESARVALYQLLKDLRIRPKTIQWSQQESAGSVFT